MNEETGIENVSKNGPCFGMAGTDRWKPHGFAYPRHEWVRATYEGCRSEATMITCIECGRSVWTATEEAAAAYPICVIDDPDDEVWSNLRTPIGENRWVKIV